jgi:hypothetical protein
MIYPGSCLAACKITAQKRLFNDSHRCRLAAGHPSFSVPIGSPAPQAESTACADRFAWASALRAPRRKPGGLRRPRRALCLPAGLRAPLSLRAAVRGNKKRAGDSLLRWRRAIARAPQDSELCGGGWGTKARQRPIGLPKCSRRLPALKLPLPGMNKQMHNPGPVDPGAPDHAQHSSFSLRPLSQPQRNLLRPREAPEKNDEC